MVKLSGNNPHARQAGTLHTGASRMGNIANRLTATTDKKQSGETTPG